MATTFGYSCKNSRAKGSGTRWLIALNSAGVTEGRQASSCSIQPIRTAAIANVTGGVRQPPWPGAAEMRCQGIVGKGVYNTVRMGEPPPVGWQMESAAGVAG